VGLKPLAAPMDHASKRHKQWRSMRMLQRAQGSFTVAEIIATAGGANESIREYLGALAKAGYIRRVRRGFSSFHYSLLRDTGPEAPRLRRSGELFDPNLRLTKEGR